MAATATPSNLEKMILTLPKSVQEMSVNGDDPPQPFIVRDDAPFGPVDTSPPLASIPTIDISLFSPLPSSLQESSIQETEKELDKLRSALSSWGCFQVIGHGISMQFLDKVREVTKKFFELPFEEKQRYGKAAVALQGYGLDPLVSEKQVLDWCDRLTVLIYPEDQRNLKYWPEKPQDFRETIDEYAMNIDSVVGILFKAMAKSLKLEVSSFSKQFGDRSVMQGRFILYPTCTRPDQVFGVKPHSDGSGVTVLLQDKEVQGLQVLKEDQWLTVPIIPHALFVNLGDQMQILSNGAFTSPTHRVVTNREREKMSVVMFKRPEPENEIEPVDQLVDEKRPRLYKKVKNYSALNYECFQKGLVLLDTLKI
ncbi:protein SRG1-like isoform X1 [Rhododendron vialii]|uniref:protein SRG1-like isoform X1 n=1 Tax=Rhododendron vialii TaxID=182163 RepID=UPI002660390D|nr:protein SRG1-like isoform X1 [Rhododendron vialii]